MRDQYTLHPHAYHRGAAAAELNGYYLPKEGANDWAIALIDFESLPEMSRAYEPYRARLADDPDAEANVAFVRQARAILAERRSFLRKV